MANSEQVGVNASSTRIAGENTEGRLALGFLAAAMSNFESAESCEVTLLFRNPTLQLIIGKVMATRWWILAIDCSAYFGDLNSSYEKKQRNKGKSFLSQPVAKHEPIHNKTRNGKEKNFTTK